MIKLKGLLVNEIKSKKQISGLSDEFVLEKLEKFFLRNGDLRKRLEREFSKKEKKVVKSKLFKEIVKKIREEIGIVYGSFLTQSFDKKEKVLDDYEKVLMTHKSTRERFDYYTEIYSKIFNWYLPRMIGDLGCGLNPVSYPIMKRKVKYFASDLNSKDMKFLNEFFSEYKIEGVAKAYDLIKLNFLEDEDFKVCDLVFLFKTLDSLEFVKKNISKEILEKIHCRHIVVSFPTKSLVSKVEFKLEKRNWFFNFLDKKEWVYETFEVENEIFILIDKN